MTSKFCTQSYHKSTRQSCILGAKKLALFSDFKSKSEIIRFEFEGPEVVNELF